MRGTANEPSDTQTGPQLRLHPETTDVTVESTFTEWRDVSSIATTTERLYPDFLNWVVVYCFPTIFGVGIVANTLSFIIIQLSDIRLTSTGVYLSVLACSDSVCLTLWTSLLWATPVLGRSFPGLHMCNVSQFGVAFFGSLSAMSIVCVTTDRFIAVWFPFKAKEITTRRRALCVVLGVILSLLAMFLPALFSYTDRCGIVEPLKLYGTTVVFILLNIFYSYGVIIYLCCLNVAIVHKLCKPPAMTDDDSRIISHNKHASKVAVIVLAVSITYVVCTVPANILITLKSTNTVTFADKYTDEIVFTFGRSLLFLNHAINFFLYILTSSNFRNTFVSLFAQPCKANTPALQTPSVSKAGESH